DRSARLVRAARERTPLLAAVPSCVPQRAGHGVRATPVAAPAAVDAGGGAVSAFRRALFAPYYRLGRSSLAIVCDARPVAWAMSMLSEMTLADVVEVLDALERSQVRAWVAGGW